MQKLSKSQNKLIKQLLILVLIIIGAIAGASVMFADSPYVTRKGHFIEQPVAFSHQTHVEGVGLDCKFCHSGVSENSSAEMPSLETCNGCHRGVLKSSDYLAPVRNGYQQNIPVKWERVNKLADHVHFNHAEHIQQGVQCTTCHGKVGEMPLMAPENHFSMQYCLECHNKVGPRLKDCSTCHR